MTPSRRPCFHEAWLVGTGRPPRAWAPCSVTRRGLERLARDLELAADVTREQVVDGRAISDKLSVEAAFVRLRPSFLGPR
jgi:hypothetical protein